MKVIQIKLIKIVVLIHASLIKFYVWYEVRDHINGLAEGKTALTLKLRAGGRVAGLWIKYNAGFSPAWNGSVFTNDPLAVY